MASKVYKVFIDGAEGTTGLLLQSRLSRHPAAELIAIDPALRKDAGERARLYKEADVVFLCLPDEAARQAVALMSDRPARVIDASTAHRTAPGWAYGFPELSPGHRDAVRNGRRVAVPGCHASGFAAAVYPLVAAGILPRDYPVSAFSLTGYTGGGKRMIADYEGNSRDPGDEALKSTRLYALTLSHKHLPEMQAVCGLSEPPLFTPAVGDFPRGMLVSVPLVPRLLNGRPGAAKIREVLAAHYEGAAFVRVMDSADYAAGGFLDAAATTGTNMLELFVFGNDERVLVTARLDNLGKGASGAALQCMNVMLGLPEETGLTTYI